MTNTALQPKFPKRLGLYNKHGHHFHIFVNDEYLLIKALRAQLALWYATNSKLSAIKKTQEVRKQECYQRLSSILRQYGIPLEKTTSWYEDNCLELTVASTCIRNNSREITICTDIGDAAEGYGFGKIYGFNDYYGEDYVICMKMYKDFGLNCLIDDIRFKEDCSLDGRAKSIAAFRLSKHTKL